MQHDQLQRRSRFILRAMEWDDPKAKYPNIWADGMPRMLLAIDRIAGRLRLGDLVATYHPVSQKHVERSDRIVGLSRVSALRHADADGMAWVELETAFRFAPPFPLEPAPRRVFLCCDPGWPAPEIALFRKIYDAAVAAGWEPRDEERIEEEDEPAALPATAPVVTPPQGAAPSYPAPVPDPAPAPAPAPVAERTLEPADVARWFAGVDYSGDMRDPRAGTWLAVLGLVDDRLRVLRLNATGRSGLEARLRDPDPLLTRAEAIGLDFPFAFPLPFAESLMDGPFPDEGWWGLVRRMERLTRPQFLTKVEEFREANGALKRLADERAEACSPLDRSGRDLSPMAFHGVRMIGEDRSRFAVRPFETAQGRLLLEVRPELSIKAMRKDGGKPTERLAALGRLPVDVGEHGRVLGERGALAAILAARCAAVAVLDGETDKTAEELAPGAGDRVLREGWIYGLERPA